MAITGNDLITRLEGLVNLQTRTEIRKVDQVLADAMRGDLAAHGAERHADGIFEILRRARREWTAARFASQRKPGVEEAIVSMPRFEEFLLSVLAPLGTFSLDDVFALYSKHGALFEELVRQLNHARSKATHILAVLRPFKERYVANWERDVDLFAGDEVRKRAHDLKSRVVSNPWDLEVWINDVFNLFSQAAVYRGDVKSESHERIANATPRERLFPAGLISESSERIYRQRWINWFHENQGELSRLVGAQQVNQVLGPSASSASNMKDIQLLTNTGVGQVDLSVETSVGSNLSEVALDISSNLDGAISAQRSWGRKDAAVKELGTWLTVLNLAWGAAGESVIAKLRLLSDSGESEVVLPAMSLEEANDRLTKIVTSYI